MIPQHLGALHPVEQALTLGLAFGPFVVLGIVVWVRRRQDAAEGRDTPSPSGSDYPTDLDVSEPATPDPSGSPTSEP